MVAAHETTRPTRVLIVDDSAVMRQTLSHVLSIGAEFDVSIAADPFIAFDKMRRDRPDVIVLDLEMPRMDGLTFLRTLQRAGNGTPVVVCSALTAADAAVEALSLGAFQVVEKPRVGLQDFLREGASDLLDAIRAAAASRRRTAPPGAPIESYAALKRAIQTPIVALGASVGGTEALALVLGRMPSDAPPLLVVQHMPRGFTAAFATRLDGLCALHVTEAQQGEVVRSGHAYIAPGGRHMTLAIGERGARVVRLVDAPPVTRHRPSVDVLFASVARVAGADAVGVLLTGMGEDGADGMVDLKRAGASTLAQDEATSIVFGMPRAAIARGCVDAVVPLSGMFAAILQASGRPNA